MPIESTNRRGERMVYPDSLGSCDNNAYQDCKKHPLLANFHTVFGKGARHEIAPCDNAPTPPGRGPDIAAIRNRTNATTLDIFRKKTMKGRAPSMGKNIFPYTSKLLFLYDEIRCIVHCELTTRLELNGTPSDLIKPAQAIQASYRNFTWLTLAASVATSS